LFSWKNCSLGYHFCGLGGLRRKHQINFIVSLHINSAKMEFTSFISDFENLPKHIQRQLIAYAEFLKSKYAASKRNSGPDNSFSFSWENGLKDLKKEYSSVELQHKINDLR